MVSLLYQCIILSHFLKNKKQKTVVPLVTCQMVLRKTDLLICSGICFDYGIIMSKGRARTMISGPSTHETCLWVMLFWEWNVILHSQICELNTDIPSHPRFCCSIKSCGSQVIKHLSKQASPNLTHCTVASWVFGYCYLSTLHSRVLLQLVLFWSLLVNGVYEQH